MKELTDKQKQFLELHVQGVWKLNSRGLVDIDGDLEIFPTSTSKKIKNLLGIRLGRLSGSFLGMGNDFDDLSGFPVEVGGDLDLGDGLDPSLVNLQGLPTLRVGGIFVCSFNQLVSLEGGPREVRGDYYCDKNKLQTLKGAPRLVGGGFYCNNNFLKTLEGAPEIVGADFDCSDNQLESLIGGPQRVYGHYFCNDNELKNLRGLPTNLHLVNCQRNPLENTVKPQAVKHIIF